MEQAENIRSRYKLFISYSTDPDFGLARRLETFLETFHRLPTPAGLTLQPLEVCRDGSDFHSTATSGIDATLVSYLSRSDELLVLCSKRARTSNWVAEEIAWFLEHRGPNCIRVAITEGDRLDTLADEVFPQALLDARLNTGIVYDFRGSRGSTSKHWQAVRPFDDERVRLAAALYGRALSDLQPIWFAEQRKRWRRTRTVAVGVAMALLALASVALWQRQTAVREAALTRRQLYVSSLALAQRAWGEGRLDVMRDALLRATPGKGQSDLRGFEWFHIARRLEAEVRRLYVDGVALGAVSISPDGTQIALAGRRWSEDDAPSRKVYIFSQQDGTLIKTLDGFSDEVKSVAYNLAGAVLVASSEREIRAWSVPGYVPISIDPAIAFGVDYVVWASNGNRLALASNGGIRIVDEQFNTTAQIEPPTGSLSRPALSPDGSALVVGSSEGKVFLWRAEQPKALSVLGSHDAPVTDVRWAGNGLVVTGSTTDRMVVLWSTDGRKNPVQLQQNGPVRSLAVSPDGRTLAVGYGDPLETETGRGVSLWDLRTNTEAAVLRGPARRVEDLAFTPDGLQLVGATEEEDAHVWDVRSALFRATTPAPDLAWMVDITADGRTVAIAGGDGTVSLWRPTEGVLLRGPRTQGWRTQAVAVDPGGRWVLSAGQDRKLTLNDPMLAKARELESAPHVHTDLRTSPDGTLLASSNCDGTLRLWRIESWEPVDAWSGGRCLNFAAWSPDGFTIASGGGDPAAPTTPTTVTLWDRRHRTVVELKGARSWPRSAAFAPDGQTLATGHWNGDVLVWSLSVNPWWKFWVPHLPVLRWTLRGHRDLVSAVAFAPDGGVLASASSDGTIRFWDLDTGQERSVLADGPKEVYDLRFAKSGKMLVAAGSEPGTVAWFAK
jgi:WD40 repeat protein